MIAIDRSFCCLFICALVGWGNVSTLWCNYCITGNSLAPCRSSLETNWAKGELEFPKTNCKVQKSIQLRTTTKPSACVSFCVRLDCLWQILLSFSPMQSTSVSIPKQKLDERRVFWPPGKQNSNFQHICCGYFPLTLKPFLFLLCRLRFWFYCICASFPRATWQLLRFPLKPLANKSNEDNTRLGLTFAAYDGVACKCQWLMSHDGIIMIKWNTQIKIKQRESWDANSIIADPDRSEIGAYLTSRN